MKIFFWKTLLLLGVLFPLHLDISNAQAANWRSHDHDRSGSRHQPDEDILNDTNIAGLEALNVFDADGTIIKSPAVTKHAVFFTSYSMEIVVDIGGPEDIGQDSGTPDGQVIPGSFYASHVYKLDKNLNLIWKRHVNDIFAECNPGQPIPPLIIQTSATVKGDKVIFGTSQLNFPIVPTHLPSGYVFAIGKNDGRCLYTTLATPPPPPTVIPPADPEGQPSVYYHVYEGVQASPVFQGNHMYVTTTSAEEEAAAFVPGYPCCKTNGKVLKMDINTGEIIWSTTMIAPELAEEGYSGVTGYASPSVVIDNKNNQVITATGDAYRRGPTEPSTISVLDLPIDSLVALDMETGEKKWVHQAVPDDFWTFACLQNVPGVGNPDNCPNPPGPNFNISAGPIYMKRVDNALRMDFDGDGKPEKKIDIVAGKVKDGNIVAVEASTGTQVWKTKVGHAVLIGLAGLSYDGDQLYSTSESTPQIDFVTGQPVLRNWTMRGGPNADEVIFAGCTSALNPSTGEINWQANALTQLGYPLPLLPPPLDAMVPWVFPLDSYVGPPSSANGLVFAQSTYPNNELNAFFLGTPVGMLPSGPNLYIFDSDNGNLLWYYSADRPAAAGPSIVDGKVYWPTGFLHESGRLYQFGLPGQEVEELCVSCDSEEDYES